MLLSNLIETYQSRSAVEVFGGYNHNIRIGDGEFYDMHDMTSAHYPAMASRQKHGTYQFAKGANIIPRPYYNDTGRVNNGVTYTVNEDGSITATRTATSSTISVFYMTGMRTLNPIAYTLAKGTYKLGGGVNTNIKVMACYSNDAGAFAELGRSVGNEVTFAVDEDVTRRQADIRIEIAGSALAVGESVTISPRLERVDNNINGMIGKDALCYVDGRHLFINNYMIENFELTDSPKQLISMGAYIVIFPDKKYINTKDFNDRGSIEASYNSSGFPVSYTMCNLDGEAYNDATISDVEPANPEGGAYWIDTSSTPHTLKQYAASSSMWVPIATTYVKIQAMNIGDQFKQYDGVHIEGITVEGLSDMNGKTSVIYGSHHDSENPANDYIIVVGFLDEVQTREDEALKITRNVPVMDFVVESNNRLWGCRYGTNADGKPVNEIYASKLGDFKNWSCYMGLSTDSYAVSLGTDGQFTGAISYMGFPIFFKENVMHKLYGNYPANYQVQTTPCRGVQKGAGNSLAIVGETLLYKTRNGVAIYEGSLPTEISNAFGNIKYSAVDEAMRLDDPYRCGAVGGALGQKYFISMKSEADDKWYTFSFDINNNMWFKEFEGRVLEFCSNDGELYYLLGRDAIKTWNGSGVEDEEPVKWMVESGRIGTNAPEKKYISRYIVRLMLEKNARADISIEYDSEGRWRHIQTIKGTNMKTVSFPIRPRRCDHFRIKIEGVGDGKIFSLIKFIEEGSDK